jgi:hypothetical protein
LTTPLGGCIDEGYQTECRSRLPGGDGANHANGKSGFSLGSIAYQHRAAGAGSARGNVLFKRANAAVANEKPPSLGGFLS